MHQQEREWTMAGNNKTQKMLRDFGHRLRAARITAGYDRGSDMAKELGIEPPRYRKYERGQSLPPLDILASIVAITGRSSDWLLLNKKSEA